jgi:myo-inositol-1-phosphate synthase
MHDTVCTANDPLLLLVAGAKGAIGSTVAVAAHMLRQAPGEVLPSLTTCGSFDLGPCPAIQVAGWDIRPGTLSEAVAAHGVLPPDLWQPISGALDRIPIGEAPEGRMAFGEQVTHLMADMARLREAYPGARPVFVNLLPAGRQPDGFPETLAELYDRMDPGVFPDLPYALAAISSGIPVVNFTPNVLALPALVKEARAQGVPMAGRDGKTGQTYFKVVLASAFKARGLVVDGWYSANILGNADGANLMDPDRAAGKVANKTNLLDTLLGYRVGERYGRSTHQVRIDYYPPRGDAKEAWDVIDFRGLFGLPMSLRLNLQGRDSILAAPMLIDLARWVTALRALGRSGPVPDLGLYFKVPVGDQPPVTFQEQVWALERLARHCREAGGMTKEMTR